MTGPDRPPPEPESDDDVRAHIAQLDGDQSELRRQAHEMREELADEGPMDGNDRSAIITQAEELESFAADLGRRRETLQSRLDTAD